jgi:hypothetical protein
MLFTVQVCTNWFRQIQLVRDNRLNETENEIEIDTKFDDVRGAE